VRRCNRGHVVQLGVGNCGWKIRVLWSLSASLNVRTTTVRLAIFSIVQGIVLAPLPFSHPDRLMVVLQNNLTMKHVIYVSYPDFLDWQRSAHSFQQMAAVVSQDLI